MSVLNNSLQTYPVQWAGFLRACVLCGCAFGWKLSGEQIAAVMLVVESGLTVYTHQVISDQDVNDAQAKIMPAAPANHRIS